MEHLQLPAAELTAMSVSEVRNIGAKQAETTSIKKLNSALREKTNSI